MIQLRADHQYQSLELNRTSGPRVSIEDEVKGTAFRLGFQKSPWFSSDAKTPLTLTVHGQLEQQLKRTPTFLTHSYTDTETVEELETVSKTRKVPFQASELVRQSDGSQRLENVTRFREESYLAQEKVKKTRNVPKTLRFAATHIAQEMDWNLEIAEPLSSQNFTFQFKRKESRQGNEHSEVNPQIGLKPLRFDPLTPPVFLEKHREALATEFEVALRAHWVSKFCKPTAPLSIEKLGMAIHPSQDQTLLERVEVCLHGIPAKTRAPAFAEELYQNRYGITVAQWREIPELSK